MSLISHDSFARADDRLVTSLPELLASFSYALDLTEGQPAGHSIRSCWIASQLAERIGLDPTERRTVYYATLLKDLGCSSNAARIAELYLTDDRSFKHDFKLVGRGLGPTLRFVFRKTGSGQPLAKRARAIGHILKNGPEIARSLVETRCTRGAAIARLLRFPEAVALAIASLDEHWDGGGKPQGIAGAEIPLAARLALLAQIVDVFHQSAGAEAACAEIARQAGVWLDPALCAAFLRLAREPTFWRGLERDDIERQVVALQPDEAELPVDEDYLDDIALAFGQVIDAKSPYTAGHSERVGHYARAVGRSLGLGGDALRALHRAAILHDVGKLGVSSTILEKPGRLDAEEWAVMQRHAGHTADILSRIGPLRQMAMIAGSHHERLDGAGYPLGLDASMLCLEARIITACDFYDALTADRPYRAALPGERALAIMREELGGALDPACFAALAAVVQAEA